LLALCATENTRSRPVLLFTKQFLERLSEKSERALIWVLMSG
jgi:hypothetical protein